MTTTSPMTPFAALNRTFALSEPKQVLTPAVASATWLRGHAFNVGAFHLVVDTSRHPCEVYEDLPLCRLPQSPPYLVGMANQRGNIVPVFDLNRLLGYTSDAKTRYVLVVGSRDSAVGLQITSLPKRVAIAAHERITTALPVPERLGPHIREFYQQHDQMFADWDIQGFMASLASTP